MNVLDVKEAMERRRAYRSLGPVEITDEIIRDLAQAAALSASCFNNQPWRFVFVKDRGVLKQMQDVISKGNAWTSLGSMVIAAFSRPDLDCQIGNRDFYLFDLGMATAFIILRATELGLVAHPIAGFSPKKAKAVLGIPEEMMLLTLVIVGRKKADLDPLLSEKQATVEGDRPKRMGFNEFAHLDTYSE